VQARAHLGVDAERRERSVEAGRRGVVVAEPIQREQVAGTFAALAKALWGDVEHRRSVEYPARRFPSPLSGDAERRRARQARRLGQLILLSLTASLNPTLLAATTVMLLLPSPSKLMLGYLLGAYITSIALGLVIVFALPSSGATSTTRHTLSPAVDIALGALALLAAWVVRSGRHERVREHRRARKPARNAPPRWQRELSKGSARTTFLIGMALTLPGASYIAGLTVLHKLDYSTTATVLVVIGFNVVMLWLLEVPLIGFLVAPDWTRLSVARARGWIARHAHVFAVRGLAFIGAALVVKGVIGLA